MTGVETRPWWRLPAFWEGVLRWYGTILFSPRLLPGALVALATLGNPDWGVCGLVCALLTWGFGRFLEFPAVELDSGIYGCNGILFGLFVGSHFSSPALLALVCLGGSFLVCLLTRGFTNSVGALLKLPACSYPFVVATIVFSVFARSQEAAWGVELIKPFSYQTSYLATYLARPFHLTLGEQAVREVFWFGSSLGAIFFQKAGWSCLLVGIALFTSSRALLALAVAGFAAMRAVCLLLPFAVPGQEVSLGFNAVLIAIGVGGSFLVPGRRTLGLMVLCQAAAVPVGLGLAALGSRTGAEFTALPFNLLVSGALLMLQGRAFDAKPHLPALAFTTPEEAFSHYRRYRDRMFLRAVALPVFGTWQIVQGFDGPETHQQQWRFGLDLAAVDEAGRRFRTTGVTLDDYYAFGAVIRSPADGTVAGVWDQSPDNPVGEMNLKAPWGNYVLIYSAGIYLGLYHLKQGSVVVVPGQTVSLGTPVGRGGNSGRSALPHLHFQVQVMGWAGAANLPFLLTDTVLHRPEGEVFRPFSRPEAGAVVSEIEAGDELRPLFLPAHGETWRLRVTEGQEVRGIDWTFHYTLHGNVVIAENTEDEAEYRLSTRSLEMLRFPRRTGSPLHLFALAVADLPFHFREGLSWTTTLYGRSASALFRWKRRLLAVLFGDIFSLDFQKECLEHREDLAGGEAVYHVVAGFPHRHTRGWWRDASISLELAQSGFRRLELRQGGQTLLTAERIAGEGKG